MDARPLILVTNDDGVLAPGLEALAEAARALGDVVVAAPERERSGSSHAITLHAHLRATALRERWYAVAGSPVDCVYLGSLKLCPRPPDLVLSGVNPGYNLGSDVFYSGTVGAAAEGFMRGASAIAFSVDRESDPRSVEPIVHRLAQRLLAAGERHLWNVNIPPGAGRSEDEILVTRLGRRNYQETVEERVDLMGKPYYWIGGPPQIGDHQPGEDTWAVQHGKISLTPLELDITARDLERTRRLLAGAPEREGSDTP